MYMYISKLMLLLHLLFNMYIHTYICLKYTNLKKKINRKNFPNNRFHLPKLKIKRQIVSNHNFGLLNHSNLIFRVQYMKNKK